MSIAARDIKKQMFDTLISIKICSNFGTTELAL
jgi:hypothetical protein